MATIHIGILEDHPMIQEYLSSRVKEIIPNKTYWDKTPSATEIQLDFVVDTFDKFKSRLRRENAPSLDILLLDLSFDNTDRHDGKEVAVYCAKYYKHTKIIVISDFLKDEREALLKIPNVKRCLSKTDIFNKKKLLGDTIIEVGQIDAKNTTGKISGYLKEKEPLKMIKKLQFNIEVVTNIEDFEITPSKKPILEFLALGKTPKQIASADCLDKAQATIDKHLAELRQSFGVPTNEALIVTAIHLGVLVFRA
jgi:hypothetical protein